MTRQHTKGPWLVTKDKHGMDANHSLVCVIDNGTEDMTLLVHAEAETGDPLATANVIAAAPDLLIALEKIAAWHGQFPGSGITPLSEGEQRDFMRAIARQSIAKATKA